MAVKNDLQMNHVGFDVAGYMAAVKGIISFCLDSLSIRMQDVMKQAIESCSESSSIMKAATTALVRERSRSITNTGVEIEVGVDPSEAGSEQQFIRASVTLFGNGSVWARAGGSGWTKHVGYRRVNHVSVDIHLTQFEQGDHSANMVDQFEREIKKDAKDFLDVVMALIAGIDMSKFITVS